MTWRKNTPKKLIENKPKKGHVMENWLKTPKRWRKETKNLVYKWTRIFAWIQSFDSVFQGKIADKASRQQWLSQSNSEHSSCGGSPEGYLRHLLCCT